ncbi:c-type cytochrome [Psychrobacter sp. AOP22-C1-22]|uniref:c-type cytochrome n=1 Tax=unclassified Psychrobacter TaxID=196806 RepID=UPI001CE422F3|nr:MULTISPECIES: c-type cytochrome [unclassified Psychrobacter]MDN5801269.1 c-type cytochrome [Psychrobacter sp.]
MKKTAVNTALWTTLILSMGISLSACSSEKEDAGTESGKVMAVDRVDDASELARSNAPEAEDMEFPETTAVPATDVEADATTNTEEGSESEEEVAADTSDTTDSAALNVSDNTGEQLYNNQCMACHATGLLDAPKYGDAEAWAPRITQGKETLYTHSAKGFNQMPAQATNGVTEEQIHAAVDYMVAAAS